MTNEEKNKYINKDNDKIVTLAERERASKYVEHNLGFAYIPPQDLPMYEKAYKKVNPTR